MSFIYPFISDVVNLDRDDSDYSSEDSSVIVTHRTRPVVTQLPVVIPKMPKKNKQQTPQEAIDEFWGKFNTKKPGKATTVIPHNTYVQRAAKHARKKGVTTQASYEEAAEVCKAKVAKIVKECRRVNQKYRDPHFDLEWDLKWGKRDTLETLNNVKTPAGSEFKPKSVKRVPDIFDNPKFYIDGPTANDVRQGRDGDCWLMAALCTLSNKPGLIERCCVARDEQVGVYGFVFHRDGEWISEIIDDKLFLTKPDFEESFLERMLWEDRERVESEEQYRKAYQCGSGALYFAQCVNANETWLPLLEKAYAKAHGDYAAIEGGFTGEGIEDLTGGVTSEIYTKDILDKEYFWKEELMKVNDEFLFGCSTGMWGIGWGERRGIVELHAYSVMKAVEIDGQRLVLLKNPWGKGEWKGPWSDGSKEWTAEWLVKLDHRFGDDGAFWISYKDLLRKYQAFDRTRLFSSDWKVTSLWTTLSIPWTLDYQETQFAFSLAKTSPVVIVLSQLDDRYYRGLEGQYCFTLNFRLHKAGQEDYVVRSITPYCQKRSINVELELEAGDYMVLLKINAVRNMEILPIEEVVRNNARDRRDKLVAVGMSYDLAHSKGKIVESAEEKQARKEAEQLKREEEKQALRAKIMFSKERIQYGNVKAQAKRRERQARRQARRDARAKSENIEASDKLDRPGETKLVEEPNRSRSPQRNDRTKRVQIRTPSPTTPNLDDSEHNLIATSPGVSDSGSDTSFKTPSTGSGESSLGAIQGLEEVGTGEEVENETLSNTDPSRDQDVRNESRSARTASPVQSQGSSEKGILVEERNVSGAKVCCCSARPRPPPPPDAEFTSDESDISSVSDISDRELEFQLDSRNKVLPPAPQQPAAPVALEIEDEFESDPWNAVATVGVRLYYKVSDDDRTKEIVKLRVVRPVAQVKRSDDKGDSAKARKKLERKSSKDDTGSGTEDADDEIEMGLDVDDSSKDATLVGDQARRKKSIVPTKNKST